MNATDMFAAITVLGMIGLVLVSGHRHAGAPAAALVAGIPQNLNPRSE